MIKRVVWRTLLYVGLIWACASAIIGIGFVIGTLFGSGVLLMVMMLFFTSIIIGAGVYASELSARDS